MAFQGIPRRGSRAAELFLIALGLHSGRHLSHRQGLLQQGFNPKTCAPAHGLLIAITTLLQALLQPHELLLVLLQLLELLCFLQLLKLLKLFLL